MAKRRSPRPRPAHRPPGQPAHHRAPARPGSGRCGHGTRHRPARCVGQGPYRHRLVIALAGRDPDVPEERGRTLRADYLRLLDLGPSSGRAELILGISGAGAWRGDDPTFAAACDAVSAASHPCGASRVIRLTPQRGHHRRRGRRHRREQRGDLPASRPGRGVRQGHGRRAGIRPTGRCRSGLTFTHETCTAADGWARTVRETGTPGATGDWMQPRTDAPQPLLTASDQPGVTASRGGSTGRRQVSEGVAGWGCGGAGWEPWFIQPPRVGDDLCREPEPLYDGPADSTYGPCPRRSANPAIILGPRPHSS
ncbi:hypothetical protein SAMN05428944_0293 [Streptomyces sp. 1222.5]|nr:hypothetical protein BX260_7802 [Streptomyces sp. 5112.2]SEB56287.1 hypothetical protein SAMN05428944_0293 [Streptomyces sp. 1222.5]